MRLLLALLLSSLAAPASAQPRDTASDPATARALREEAAALVAVGRYETAYERARLAAEGSDDPAIWLELAEIADRLRVNGVALSAYQRFLELSPRSERRPELEGRVRLLRAIVAGGRFVPGADGRSLSFLASSPDDANTARRPAGSRRTSILVDWQGQPLVIERHPSPLASWSEAPQPETRPEARPEARPGGLGRQLSTP